MNILNKICDDKQEWVSKCKQNTSIAELEEQAAQASKPRGFAAAIKHSISNGKDGLIAEIKKASPSKGLIRSDFNPSELAKVYQSGGASCLSVLTDIPYFQGDDSYLQQARSATTLPVLRKDFMVDSYQIIESRALGADCILLIMAALSNQQAQELEAQAHSLGMDTLVEIHDEDELDRTLTHLNPSLLGINNRNLKTMDINLATTERLVKLLPTNHNHTIVCESGIYHHDDIQRMHRSNIHSFLVGESLMRQDDVEAATRELLNM